MDHASDLDEPRPTWRHPQGGAAPSGRVEEGAGRYVDHDFFVDHVPEVSLRRGARVRHDRFGEGEVVRVVSVGETAVVAVFPGWGEKKILARFLKPAE